jgi:hypothetical protein
MPLSFCLSPIAIGVKLLPFYFLLFPFALLKPNRKVHKEATKITEDFPELTTTTTATCNLQQLQPLQPETTYTLFPSSPYKLIYPIHFPLSPF